MVLYNKNSQNNNKIRYCFLHKKYLILQALNDKFTISFLTNLYFLSKIMKQTYWSLPRDKHIEIIFQHQQCTKQLTYIACNKLNLNKSKTYKIKMHSSNIQLAYNVQNLLIKLFNILL